MLFNKYYQLLFYVRTFCEKTNSLFYKKTLESLKKKNLEERVLDKNSTTFWYSFFSKTYHDIQSVGTIPI